MRVAEVTKGGAPHKLTQDGLHGRDTIIAYHGAFARVGRQALSLLLGEKVLIQPLKFDNAVAADTHIMLDQQVCQFRPVDQDHALSEAFNEFLGWLSESGGSNEDALGRPRPTRLPTNAFTSGRPTWLPKAYRLAWT